MITRRVLPFALSILFLLLGLPGNVSAGQENNEAFRAALSEFLVAQNTPESIAEQMAFSLAQNALGSIAAQGITITEQMQSIISDVARSSFGLRFNDIEFLTNLYAPIYAANFTEAEIRELARFWNSALGKKTIGRRTVLSEGTYAALQEASAAFIPDFQTNVDKSFVEAGILLDTP